MHMDSIVKKIFNKELGYHEFAPKNKEYQEAYEEYCKCYETLEATLNEDQQNLLSDLYLSEGSVQGALEFIFFKEGFCAGLKLGVELSEEK